VRSEFLFELQSVDEWVNPEKVSQGRVRNQKAESVVLRGVQTLAVEQDASALR